jgi:glycosyltransferase involved in cell wall biosynthesis
MKITIITTTYNNAATIHDTIKSVLSQTYKNFEYIVIDGLSNDNTVGIINEYKTKFEGRLRLYSEKDNGIYDAMNKGIKMSTGDIIGILNADDFFTSNNIIETVAKSFENNHIDAVYGDVHFVNSINLNKSIRYYSSKIFKRPLMRIGMMPAHPSFYTKKSVYEKLGLYKTNYKICADFDLLLRFIYIHKINIMYLPVDMVTMRIGGVSTNGLNSRLLIMHEQLRSFKENGLRGNVILLSSRYFIKIFEFIFIKNKLERLH